MKNNILTPSKTSSWLLAVVTLVFCFVHFPLFSNENETGKTITETEAEATSETEAEQESPEIVEPNEISEEERKERRGKIVKTDHQDGLFTLHRYYNKETLEYSFYVTNESYDNLNLTLKLTLEQMEAYPAPTVQLIIPPLGADIHLITAKPIDPYKSHRFGAQAEFKQGDPQAIHDGTYAPPFEKNRGYYLANAFFGNLSHKGKYAVDFNMPVGTMVCAAREGVVVRMKNDGNRGGPSPSFNDDGNYISILHRDGTYGNYAHFRQGGVLVKVGDTIEVGQEIGYSGNTGYSTGPHLHFDVSKANGRGGFTTLPFQFRKSDGTLLDPETGMTLVND